MVSILGTLACTALMFFPMAYFCARWGKRWMKLSLLALVWFVFLTTPLYFRQDLPIHHVSTMLTAVLTFMLPQKLTQLVLFPRVKRESETSLLDFVSFAGSFLYYMMPVSRRASSPPTSYKTLLLGNLEYFAVIVSKIVILPLLEQYCWILVSRNEQFSPDTYIILLMSFTGCIIASSWINDVQCVVISLLSIGRLEMLPMHNYPFLASSLRDLWGRRYNRLINEFLKDTVYLPAQQTHHFSKSNSAALCFIMSGLLHSWVAYFTFGRGIVRAFLFFIVQPIWIQFVESSGWYKKLPVLLQSNVSVAFFFLSLPLYGGLFVEAMPSWLEKNPYNTPEFPVLSSVTNILADVLGLESASNKMN